MVKAYHLFIINCCGNFQQKKHEALSNFFRLFLRVFLCNILGSLIQCGILCTLFFPLKFILKS